MSAASQPYLSVVVTARNDDHGGNLLGRMQAFVNGLLNQCARHKIPAELIIVEWNPPADRAPLASALHWNAAKGNGFCEVRVVEVPNELHRRLEHWRALPLYQMIGKNVGIRRARGEFILATNIDILFSDELMNFIGERRLEPGKMYRIDRWDVEPDVPVEAPVEEQLAYCNTHTIRVNAREGTFRVSANGAPILEKNDIAAPGGGVTLGSRWFPREMSGEEPFRWVENGAELMVDPAPGTEATLVLDVEPGPGVQMGEFTLSLRDAEGKRLGAVNVKRRTIVTFPLGLNGGGPVSLYTEQGGAKIASDPRTLNFRVFRCTLQTGSETTRPAAGVREESAQTRPAQSWASRAGRGLKLLRELCTSSVELRVPMSKRSLDRLQLRQDGSGVSFFAGPLTGVFRRGGGLDGMLGPGLSAIWGDGWYPLENFRGETFQWMRRRGTVVLWLPPGPVSRISLIVENGPAVGFAPVELEIQDEWEKTLARATVNGRTKVDVAIPQARGAVTLGLIVHGGGAPKDVAGDARILALRLLRCECPVDAPQETPAIEPGEATPRSGIWCGRGWKRSARGGLSFGDSAELALKTPQEGDSRLTLEMELAATADLVIRDSYDRELLRCRQPGKATIVLPGTFAPATYCVLRFEMEGRTGQTQFALTSVCWATGDAPPVRVTIQGDRGRDLAVHLHTNACGDFTLAAREHWMDLRGYAELDVFSMNVDSLFCWTAHYGGAQEEFLGSPMRIFHIEHATGSGWTPEGQDKLYERITAKGIQWLSYDDVVQWARAMNRFNAPMIFNHEDWGLGGETLRETRPGGREGAGAA